MGYCIKYAMGIKGVQGIGGATSYVRAIGTRYAKAAISAGAGYLGNEAGEAMGLPKWASFLIGVGAGTVAGFGTEALDRNFNISGYHINSYGELMTPEETARYNQYWDDVATGKHLPPGMDADDLARYNLGLQKVDENLALSKIDPDALTRLRAEEAARVNALSNGEIHNYQNNMIENPGPLADIKGQPAKNFYGGRYNEQVLTEDKIYYRAGTQGEPLGQWFTSEPAKSAAQARIDSAIKPQWIDPATGELTGTSVLDTNYAIKIPKGTTVYEGPIAPQGGVFCGGNDVMQTFIQAPWKLDYEVISQMPLK